MENSYITYKGEATMFITQLTKYDWYRIYKYLWKEQLVPASKIRRTIIKICAVSQRLLSLPELSNQVRKNYMLICNVLHEYF